MVESGRSYGLSESGDRMGIAEFLEARFDEDEEAAQNAAGWDLSGSVRDAGLWRREGVNSVIDNSRRLVVHGDGPEPDGSQAEHIVRHDPARSLREVAVKRELLKAHREVVLRADDGTGNYDTARLCRSCAPDHAHIRENWPCPTVLHLASVYDDHPDCQTEWRP
ncbi:DUF6221 family protein [Rhodococcus qingshengii]|uniref:DUF6221 family protein n=1 Tax=Rhodococcus qingshengii TaxID=334542 RepID=UPI0035568AE5